MSKNHTIIVLGGALNPDNSVPLIVRKRLEKGRTFFHTTSDRIIVSGAVCGGSITQAEGMKRYLIEKGIPESCIIKEELPRDTIGEAYFIKNRIILPNNISEMIVVTSDFHIERTKYLFDKIFGSKYVISYIPAETNIQKEELRKIKTAEKRIFLLTQLILRGLKSEDNEKIANFLHKRHPFYMTNSRIIHKIIRIILLPSQYRNMIRTT